MRIKRSPIHFNLLRLLFRKQLVWILSRVSDRDNRRELTYRVLGKNINHVVEVAALRDLEGL